MEDYIKKLLEQVRFKKAHKGIEEEIRAHIEDQIDDNMKNGMDRKAAEEAAVADMGDPVEAGVSMDSVHRPRFAWGVVAIAVLIGIMSCVIHELIVLDAKESNAALSAVGSYVFYTKVIFGLLAMIAVYMIDYTVIAKYAKILALGMLIVLLLGRLGEAVYGLYKYLTFGPVQVLSSAFMLLYIPLFGAIVYKYRGGGASAFIKTLIWMIIPVLFVMRWPSLFTSIVLLTTMAVQLSIAVAKGWFKVPKKITITTLWAAITVLPVSVIAILYAGGFMSDYQIDRINSIFNADNEASYVTNTVRSLGTVNFVGNTGKDVFGVLPESNSDYLLTYLANRFGALMVIVILATVATVIITGCIASAKSKNQLGLVMGVGCMNVLLVNMVVNLFENLGILPYTASFMPFFSAGASNIVLAYIFLGIILSIYKYRDAYSQHVDTAIRFRIGLGKDIELIKN